MNPVTRAVVVNATDNVVNGMASRGLAGENPLNPRGLAEDVLTTGKGKPAAHGVADAAEAGRPRLPWTSWQDYPKKVVDGQEYADIGGRLYSHHAVDRMQPSGMRYSSRPGPDEGGSTGGMPQIRQTGGEYDYGRSVSPNVVEDVIERNPGIPQENGNFRHEGGDVSVILSPEDRVVTIMTK